VYLRKIDAYNALVGVNALIRRGHICSILSSFSTGKFNNITALVGGIVGPVP
jgi:hypothetical protein